MSDRVATAAHWGIYEGQIRTDGGLPEMRPAGDDPDPARISANLADVADPRARIPCPLVREGYLANGPDSREGRGRERYVPVAWDSALDLAAEALQSTRDRLGSDGVFGGSYGWASAGRFHHAQSQLKRFLNLTGGYVAALNTYSSAAAEVVVTRFLGSFGMINAGHDWPTIRENTELLVCFGGLPFKNAQIDAGSTGPHVDNESLDSCLKAGVEVVSVSPIRHEHDNLADVQWLAPRPNSDVALMLACAHWLIEHGNVDHAFLERCCVGGDQVIAYVMGESDSTPKTPAWAAALTELDEATIVDLARRMAEKRTLIAVAWALQRADNGEQPFWMACALAALLGGIGRPGEGMAYGLGTFNNYGVGRLPFRKAAFPQIKPGEQRYIPVSRVADMLLQPGSTMPYNGEDVTMPEIGLVWWAGGNPFHHHQDLHRLVQAFRRPDTVIVHDSFFQPTCRVADIVLPATTFLERNDWAASAHGGFFTPMHKLADPFGEARNDHDICADLADRFGKRDDFTEGRDEMGWIRHMWGITRNNAHRAGCDLPDFETFWSGGMLSIPTGNDTTAKLAKLREDPDAHPLPTPSGKIELFSETIAGFGYNDCPGHAVWREPREWLGSADAAHHPLHLMSDQPAGRLHSQLDPGSASQATKIRGREPCLIHPDDAAARGIVDGDILRIFNGRGACLAGAVVTERIRPGVINVATGSWFDSDEPGEPSALERHGNPNVLTRDQGCSSLSQGPSCNSALVQCERFGGNLPPVEAYDLPIAD
ncbi:MAG: molybdopterin-dependent oxidoreductase [Rhodospirillales bacterium]|nr:molybdopterin-dependent oxidoreductase [Rhodospirillales bacterium]